MKDIYIVGAGGFGREVAWLIEDINEKNPTWNIKGFIDDNKESHKKEFNGHKVLGDVEFLNEQKKAYVTIAIGTGSIREKLVERIKNHKYPVLIHPSVIISKYVEIGEGTIICAGSILTTNIKIGKQNVISIGSKISHDGIFEDYITILPSVNLSGNVLIGKKSTIGTGAAIIQGLKIGDNTFVGAGSTAIRDIEDNVIVVGSPTKVIKINKE